jgi:hypothetical protein
VKWRVGVPHGLRQFLSPSIIEQKTIIHGIVTGSGPNRQVPIPIVNPALAAMLNSGHVGLPDTPSREAVMDDIFRVDIQVVSPPFPENPCNEKEKECTDGHAECVAEFVHGEDQAQAGGSCQERKQVDVGPTGKLLVVSHTEITSWRRLNSTVPQQDTEQQKDSQIFRGRCVLLEGLH